MNKLLLCFLLAATSTVATAQKLYFIYLQSEPEQPFYIKISDKVQSSSASGYLILPKLRDSTYTFTVGFLQNKWPEQNFEIPLNRKDQGFLLKNFGEKGWGLFNLQTLVVQMSSGANAKTDVPAKEQNKDVSAFTETLSKAADDPSLKDKPVQPVVEEKKSEPVVKEVVAKSEPVVVKQEPVAAKPEPAAVKLAEVTKPVVEKKEEPPIAIVEPPIVKAEEVKMEPAVEYKMAVVTKRSESSTTEGFGLVYVVNYETGISDTVRLLIPNPKPAVVPVNEEVKEEKKMLDIPVEVVKAEEKPVEIKPAEIIPVNNQAVQNRQLAKVNCPELANEPDFFKLRKIMAAADNDDEMINEAKKYFKVKCFTASQIKNLGALFLSDEGKYKFYDASYTHTSDMENFSALQVELKEEYYINRFKAMLRN
jgi:hypothetical protein